MGFLSKLYESVRVNSTIVDHLNSNTIYNASTQTIGSGNESVTADAVAFKEALDTQVVNSEGTSYNIDLEAGNYHKVTMTGDVDFDFTNVDSTDVNSVYLHLVQDGTGSRSPSFTTPTVHAADGSAPSWSTGANDEDIAVFVHDQDGSKWILAEGPFTLGAI